MKKIILPIFLILLSTCLVFSQSNTFPTYGNVGIGLSAPIEKVHVQDGNILIASTTPSLNMLMGSLKFSWANSSYAYAGIAGMTNGGGLDQVDLLFYTAYGPSSEKMRIMSNTGYVGIGTSTPRTKLDVRGTLSIGTTRLITMYPDFAGQDEIPPGSILASNGTNSLSISPSNDIGSASAKVVLNYFNGSWRSALEYANVSSGYTNLLLMKSGGNVLIGRSSQANSSYKLDVNGDARINKVIVNTTGADFVFDSAYHPIKLDSISAFIRKHHHLPGVPSADDMQKDGLDVGDNQMKLLQKIEELTLIVIEQNKEINRLKFKIDGNSKAKIRR